MRWVLAALSLWLLAVPAFEASAQLGECTGTRFDGDPDLESFPGDGAEGVAIDAPIRVRHRDPDALDRLEEQLASAVSSGCGAELLCLFRDDSERDGDDRVAIAAEVQRVDARTVVLLPDGPLRPDSRHVLSVARSGFERPSFGEIVFETGSDRDREPPGLDGNVSDIAVGPFPEQCGVAEHMRRIEVVAPAIEDDGDEGSVELLLYLVEAPGLEAPELRARERYRGHALPMAFALEAERLEQRICLSLMAVDGVGKVAEAPEPVCFEPSQAVRFQAGCGLAARTSADRGPAHLVPWLLMLTLGLIRRRRAVATGGER